MPSRGVRRRRHKRNARLARLPQSQKDAEGGRLLKEWGHEAQRRARRLMFPPVWKLPLIPHVREAIRHLDPGGGLQADLNRRCAEAIAWAADPRMVQRGSRR